MRLQRLENLIQDLNEGIISSGDLQELETELLSNPEAMRIYLAWMDLDNLLHVETSVRKHAMAQVIPMERIIHRQRKKMLRIATLSAAALVIIGLSVLALFHIPENTKQQLTFRTSPGSRFTLIHHESGENSPSGMIMEKGSHLELAQGSVELTFSTGVTSIVMAPATMTLQGDNQIYLKQGTAWFQVPDGAEGFTVSTDDLDIIDLGTEFGVIASPNNHDEVHVFKGKVEVSAKRVRKESTILIAGEARRITSIGKLDSNPANSDAFLKTLPKSPPYIHWSFDIIDNYGFKAQGNHPDLNLSLAIPRLDSPQSLTTNGRFGSAARFTGNDGQQLDTKLPGIEGDAPRSISCWIRTDYSPDNGTNIAGIIGWGYCPDDQKTYQTITEWSLQVGIHGFVVANGGVQHIREASVADGKWHHLVCVMQPSENKETPMLVTLYIDGKIQSTKSHYSSQRSNTLIDHPLSTPVRIGASIHQPQTTPIVFKGDIDEVYLFYGALDEATIQSLYKNNHPHH